MGTHLPGLRNSHGVEPWGGGSWKELAVGGKAPGVSCRLCVCAGHVRLSHWEFVRG